MEKRTKKYEIIYVIILVFLTMSYFAYNHLTAETRGINAYSKALEIYKNADEQPTADNQRRRKAEP